MDKETGRTGLPGASPLSSKKKEEDLRAMVVSGHEVPGGKAVPAGALRYNQPHIKRYEEARSYPGGGGSGGGADILVSGQRSVARRI